MKRLLASFLVILAAGGALAKDAEPQDGNEGVKVGKPSLMAKLVPPQYVESQAVQQYQGLKVEATRQGALVPDQDPQVVRLRRIAKQLIPYADRWNARASQWQWEVNLIASNQVNAFCMPGGKIAFFTGILKSLKLTDDEIAIVMGHEMAHALREHGRERMAKGAFTQFGAAIFAAGMARKGYDVHQAANAGAHLIQLGFSRANETEADLVGLDIAARAGYDPRAGVALWQKMAIVSKGAPPQWLSTHPAGENRIKEIRKHLPEVMPLYAKAKELDVKSLPPYKSNVSILAPIE
jgi:predicted Zn-dependent protease